MNTQRMNAKFKQRKPQVQSPPQPPAAATCNQLGEEGPIHIQRTGPTASNPLAQIENRPTSLKRDRHLK